MEPSTKKRTPFLPFDIDYLTQEMVKRAEEELNETNETRREALLKMRKLVKEDPRYSIPMDDKYLLIYLRNRKFNIKKTMNQLHATLHLKHSHSQIFDVMDFQGFKELVKEQIVSVLPYRDFDGAVIMVIRLHRWDMNQISMDSVIRCIANACIACVDLHDATQICGIKLIVDVQGLCLKHARIVTPKYLGILVKGLTNVFPVRIRAVHILNENLFVQYAWSVMKFVMSEKMKKRVFFHANDMDSLHSYVFPDLLPEEYGGTVDTDSAVFLKKLDETEERYYALWGASYKKKSSREES